MAIAVPLVDHERPSRETAGLIDFLVPLAGLEPARPCGQQILSHMAIKVSL